MECCCAGQRCERASRLYSKMPPSGLPILRASNSIFSIPSKSIGLVPGRIGLPHVAPDRQARRGQSHIVFDRDLKRLQKDRAARSAESKDADYLRDEIAERMVDRLLVGMSRPDTWPRSTNTSVPAGH